jgi:tRNA-Thr(GGU) m(6)t(6)A37 methyltransferase TsaA
LRYDAAVNNAKSEEAASLVFIGRIETPYSTLGDCPYNVNPGGPLCRIVIDERYASGLVGIEPGARILVLYWLDRAKRDRPLVAERRSGKVAGAFAARTPHRPNPVGAAVVTVEAVEGATLTVRGMDCVSGTPLIDIKPAMRAEAPSRAAGG